MKRIGLIVHTSGILLALCALALATAAAQTFTTTTVEGTIYAAGGAPASGTLQLSWPAFTTAAGQAVASGRTAVTISSDGFFSVNLAPNIGATPAGLYYTAVYHMSDGTTSTEYWVVPAAAQVTLSQVRAQVMPAAQAVQAVSKAYVDQSIQESLQGQVTVFGGTLTGPLYLAGDPNQPTQAADKHYVDGVFGGALPIGGGVLQGPLTGPQLGAVYQADQFPGSDFGARLQACVNGLNPAYGGVCDARNFTGALTMAANLTLSTPNATVYLPCSTLSTAASIVVPAGTRNVTLHGCASRGTSASSGSQGGTVILYSGSGAAIQVGDPAYAADTLGFHLDNLAVNTTAASSAAAQALAILRTQEIDLSGLYLLGNANQTGITLDGTGNYTGGTVQDVDVSGFQTAIHAIGHQVSNPAPTDWLNASTFVRLHIDCPTANGNPIAGTIGVNLQQGDGNTFTGGDIESCATALHLGANAQNNTIVGLRNENSTSQVVADAGSSYNNWIAGGTMFTGQLTDNGTRNSFLDTFHRSFNSLNGDWYGSQQDATVTNHFRLGIGAGNERGLYNRYQTDSGYRWTTGLSDAATGEQFYQVLDELNNVYRLSIGQYNSGQSSSNNQTAINAAGTGAVVLNGSNNAGTGGVVVGSGGAASTTVATISNTGSAQFTGTLEVGGTSQSAGTMTVRNNADAEVDYYLRPGLTASQKGSYTYVDFNGASQWYLVKDANNNWALNSAVGGLDSFKAYQSTNSGDTYVNASNAGGAVRINYETGSGSAFNIYGGNSSTLYAGFTGPTSIKFPGLAAGSGHNCLQIDNSGWMTNAGSPCGTATSVAASGLTFSDASVQTTSQQGALTGAANDATARAQTTAETTRAEAAESSAQSAANSAQTQVSAETTRAESAEGAAQATANAALPANGCSSSSGGNVTCPGYGSFGILELKPWADAFGGADCGARIIAALAALAAVGGTGEVDAGATCGPTPGLITTAITVGRNQHLHLWPTVFLTSATITVEQGGSIDCDSNADAAGQVDGSSNPYGSCVIKQAPAANLAPVVLLDGNNAQLHNVTVDGSGNSANSLCTGTNTSGMNILINGGVRNQLSHVTSLCSPGNGIQVTNSSSPSGQASKFDHVFSLANGGSGLLIENSWDLQIGDESEFENNTLDGVTLVDSGTVRFVGGDDFGGNARHGLSETCTTANHGAGGNLIENAQFGGNIGHDIYVNGWPAGGTAQCLSTEQNIITGDQFVSAPTTKNGNPWRVNGTADAIYIVDSGYNSITGNSINSPAGAAQFATGISIASASGSELEDTVLGNVVYGGAVSQCTIASTTYSWGNTSCNVQLPASYFSGSAFHFNISGTAASLSGGAAGGLPYQSGSGATIFLPGNTAATDQVVVSHGTGSAAQGPSLSNAPALSAANMTKIPYYASGYCTGTFTSNATIALGGLGGTWGCTGAPTSHAGLVLPKAVTLSNLSVVCGVSGVNSSSGVFAVYDQAPTSGTATATPITVTYGNTTTPGTVLSDTTHTFSAGAGDVLSIQVGTQPSETLGSCSATVQYQ